MTKAEKQAWGDQFFPKLARIQAEQAKAEIRWEKQLRKRLERFLHKSLQELDNPHAVCSRMWRFLFDEGKLP